MFLFVWPNSFDASVTESFRNTATRCQGYSWTNRGGTTDSLMSIYLDDFAKCGVPVNACTFLGRSESVAVYSRAVRFNHHGGLVGEFNWGDHEERELWAKKLMPHVNPVERLNQLAAVLAGPAFDDNQLEYGKRHVLNRMLME